MPESPRLPRVLLTAFDCYRDGASVFKENASRLAIEQLILQPPRGVMLTTRIYPVDFGSIRKRIEEDVSLGFDCVILTGQAPSSELVRLEMQSRNAGVDPNGSGYEFALAPDGPAELASTIDWPQIFGSSPLMGGEVALSSNAGNFLCNAALYFAILAARRRWEAGFGERLMKVGFVHVPLAPDQLSGGAPCMQTERTAMLLSRLIQLAIAF